MKGTTVFARWRAKREVSGPVRVESVIEKLVLGHTPDDKVTAATAPIGWQRAALAPSARIELLRASLSGNAKEQKRYARDIAKMWKAASGDRAAFTRASAQLRLQLLSRATLHAAREQADALAVHFENLDEYLSNLHRDG